MDPNANLSEQLKLAVTMIRDYRNGIDQADAYRLAELVLALHGWIQTGGHLPELWTLEAVAKEG